MKKTIFGIASIVLFSSVYLLKERTAPNSMVSSPKEASTVATTRPLSPAQRNLKPAGSIPPTKTSPLSDKILDPNLEASKRQLYLYQLTQSGAAAIPELARISATPIPQFEHSNEPHSLGSIKTRLEVALRITALENLDQQAQSSPEVEGYLEKILQSQNNPTLVFLANLSLSGIKDGKPGKLHRAIEAMLAEKM